MPKKWNQRFVYEFSQTSVPKTRVLKNFKGRYKNPTATVSQKNATTVYILI